MEQQREKQQQQEEEEEGGKRKELGKDEELRDLRKEEEEKQHFQQEEAVEQLLKVEQQSPKEVVVVDEQRQVPKEEKEKQQLSEMDKEEKSQLQQDKEQQLLEKEDDLQLVNDNDVNLPKEDRDNTLELPRQDQDHILQLPKEDSNLEKDSLNFSKEEKEQLQDEHDLQLQKLEQKKDDTNLEVREEEDDYNNSQLSKEEENEQLLQKQEDDLALPMQEDDNSKFQLPKEEEEDNDSNNLQFKKEEEKDDINNLQSGKEEEKDQLLQEQGDDLQMQNQEDDNSKFQLPKEEEQEQQAPQDDLPLKEEKDDCLGLLKEEKEKEKEQLLVGDDDLELAKVEKEEEKKGKADIGEDGIERGFDNNKTHHTQHDLMSTDEHEELDNDLQLAKPSSPVVADETAVVSEDTEVGGGDGNVEDVDDGSHVAEPHSPHDAAADTADDDADTGAADSEEDAAVDANMENVEDGTESNEVDITKGKRKRGKTQKKMRPTPPPRKKKDEEDVCFFCYDGGSIVLCDRRGCPKAYHPACIKRDESFFQSKHKWNCDWHICSSCGKTSHYMCYTCVHSLCKGCTKNADYVCVRGNKGFCGACMRTIMLVENVTVGDTEMAQVNFDDKSSWEYLFKDYWMDLKAKLSLTTDELTKAKNPYKGDELTKAKNLGKGIGSSGTSKEVSSGELYNVDDEKDPCLDNGGNVQANRSKKRKTKDQAKVLKKQNSLVTEDSDVDEVTPSTEGKIWATKELLEFVSHMKSGDTSMISQFDVQALLVEYIKRNNLRDPRQKSQIICDSRLRNLFGRPRVGHFEMLKLLENHFLIKEKSPADDIVRAGVPDAAGSEEEPAGSSDSRSDRRRKKRKRMEGKRSQINPNSEEYAAIDVHNINLLYLKRSLIENLMDDNENFHEMVVGSFVRIRISGGDQKQNMYRLVPVVGTSKVDESYKVGSRTTYFMLEILNLNKKEVVSIDGISNQEFLEDECRRLRQSIKCGLIKRLKVGQIQEKAMALQPYKVNDWLQAEIARLNHLRDRASETGRRKELRECVEKLDLLKSPRERQRRLHEIPDVHIDPNMDPNYESEEDVGDSEEIRQGDHLRPRSTGFGRRLLERNSSFRELDQNDMGNRVQKNLATVTEQSRNIATPVYVDRESKWSQGGGAFGLNNQNASRSQLSPTGLVSNDWSSRAQPSSDWSSRAPVVRPESHPVVAPTALPSPLASGREAFRSDLESEKMWHYQDPSRNVQGPFSIIQLRKWNAKGHFPSHFRVWRTNEKQENSILLADVLDGRFR